MLTQTVPLRIADNFIGQSLPVSLKQVSPHSKICMDGFFNRIHGPRTIFVKVYHITFLSLKIVAYFTTMNMHLRTL